MVRNTAVAPLRTGAADAVVTSGSTTVTSASGAFTSADIGRNIAVSYITAGKGANVYARIVSVTSATQVVVDTAPPATETGGVVTVYGRDANISITGGTWDRGANDGVLPNDKHSIFLRRVDGLRVRNVFYKSTGGKYAVAVGDCTNVLVENHKTACSSDAMHFIGPGQDITVRNVSGTSGDDSIPFTTTDYSAYNDCHGSFSNITISNVRANPITRMVLLSTAANESPDGHSITNVTIDNIQKTGGAGTLVYTESLADNTGSRIDNLSITNSAGLVSLRHVLHGQVTIRNLAGTINVSPDAKHTDGTVNLTNHIENLVITESGQAGSSVLNFNNVKSTIGNLTIRGGTTTIVGLSGKSVTNVALEGGVYTNAAFLVNAGCAVGDLTMRGCDVTLVGTGSMGYINGGTVTNVAIDGSKFTSPSNSYGDIVKVEPGSTLTLLTITRSRGLACRGLLQNTSAASIKVNIAECYFDGFNRLVQGAGGADVKYANVTMVNGTNTPLFATSGGALTLRGTAFTTNVATAFGRLASEVVRVIDPQLPGDISMLAKNMGDMAYNTNAALGSSVGPASSNGTNWKNIYSGAIY